ncbi:MAG: DUF1761 family protein [Actinobacteria bacterium]|nr:DUF1761 family protein [Actinomycetota bacterium]
MTFDTLGEISWLGVVVATIVYMVLGALWYGPLFGKTWMRAMGWEGIQAPGPGPIYAFPAIAYLIASMATAMLAEATASDTVGEGLVLGLVVGIGYAQYMNLFSVVFDPTEPPSPATVAVVTGLYNLISLVIAAVLVSTL